jgi:hypothetical protein
MQTYKLQETIQKYKLQGIKNISYREQYKIPVTGNSAKIPVTGNNTKHTNYRGQYKNTS